MSPSTSPSRLVEPGGEASIPIHTSSEELDVRSRAWLESSGFDGEAGKSQLVPGPEGELAAVVLGTSDEPSPWDWGALAEKLPRGTYRVAAPASREFADAAALGWALGAYRFDRLRSKKREAPLAELEWPEGCRRDRVAAAATATTLVRDLINLPASELGPAELGEAGRELAERHGGSHRSIVGAELLEKNFPAVHAVGRAAAADREPRLIDLRWGDETHPRVTLVGKGVCFDSGGLDLKPASNMKLMKKDMGGAAHALGVASMVMELGLPVRLRVLVPAVENSVSGSAMRPLDVVRTRKGLTIEIGNTDAEGRVILADALAEAASEEPSILVDFATLTGAARVALGTELPALFTGDDAIATDLLEGATAEADPLWRMPLHKPYRRLIDGKVGDVTNSADTPFAGAITAALFLQEFVEESTPWAHLDLMGWNVSSRPGRPEGGEAMGMRAVFSLIEKRFG